MKTDIDHFQARITACLEAAGRYTSALDLNILVLASSFRRLAIAINETEGLKESKISFATPNGALQQHPAFKAQREAEETILKQLKELNLTADGTTSNVERDPAVELMKEVIGQPGQNRARRQRIIKPDD